MNIYKALIDSCLDEKTLQKYERKRSFYQLINCLLSSELPCLKVRIKRGGYINELCEYPEESAAPVPKGYIEYYQPSIIEDLYIPTIMKNIGIEIRRTHQNILIPHKKKLSFHPYRFDNTTIATKNFAHIKNNTINICEYHYLIHHNDAAALKWAQTETEIRQAQIFLTIMHECKHFKNDLLCEHRAYASDYKKPTPEEELLLEVENERTAYLEEVNTIITKLLKNDTSDMTQIINKDFPWLKKELRAHQKEPLEQWLYPPHDLMKKALHIWNKHYLNDYIEQFQNNCLTQAQNSLLIPIDDTTTEFNKQRAFMYTFEIYNPHTRKTEITDLSEDLPLDVSFPKKEKNTILSTYKTLRDKALSKLNDLLPDKQTYILACNIAETLKRAQMTEYLQKLKKANATEIIEQMNRTIPIVRHQRNYQTHHPEKLFNTFALKIKHPTTIMPIMTKTKKR